MLHEGRALLYNAWVHLRTTSPSRNAAIAFALACACGGPVATDAGTDAAPPLSDGGPRDSGADAGTDAGPERPRALELRWVQRVESTQTLAVIADARLAPLPGEALAVSVSLGGAPAVFAPGTASELRVGDETQNRVTQALAFYDGDGTLRAARAVALADPILDGFSASGYALASWPDGSLLAGGRFLAGARFGGSDPEATTLATIREMPARDLIVTSEDAYLARFDAERRIVWTRCGHSETGFAHHAVVDVDVLPDGSAIVLGGYDDAITLGRGEPNETRFTLAAGAEREVFVARFASDGALVWARHVVGQASPRRVLALAGGSFALLLRHAADLTIGPGEPGELHVEAPPAGVREGDVIARFDADGRVVWARVVQADATTYPGLRDLRLGEDGSIIVAGTFRGRLEWPGTSGVAPFDVYGVEGLIAQLDAEGALVWQRRIRPVNSLQVQAVTSGPEDSTWVAATVSMHGASFAPEESEPLVLDSSTASSRLVLLRYDREGLLRAAHLVASHEVDGDDLLTLPSGDLVLLGRHGNGTVLEPGTIDEHALPPALAFRNVFLARYAPRP